MTDKDTIRREVAEYRVITNNDTGPLAANIQRMLEEGWEPLGGVGYRDGFPSFAQAMVRRAPASEKPATRYDWSSAPEWAMFATTDPDGERCWWEGEPRAHDRWWDRMSGGRHEPSNGNVFGLPMTTSDWRDSLERRPT